MVNVLIAVYYTIRSSADRQHALIDVTPQWGGRGLRNEDKDQLRFSEAEAEAYTETW